MMGRLCWRVRDLTLVGICLGYLELGWGFERMEWFACMFSVLLLLLLL